MRVRSTIALVALLVESALPALADAHVLLDGEIAQPMLIAIATHLKDSRERTGDESGLEALYLLGEQVHRLVELMNLDLLGHGQSLYGDLLARRLTTYGVRITFVERLRRYVYDLAPYEEYLRRAPQGPRAADAWFRVVAETFHRSVGTRPHEVADGDLDGLRRAIRNEELFLEQHPSNPKAREVRFFLAMDYYRLHRNSPDPATARVTGRLARQALQEITREQPGTAEARTAEVALKDLGALPAD